MEIENPQVVEQKLISATDKMMDIKEGLNPIKNAMASLAKEGFEIQGKDFNFYSDCQRIITLEGEESVLPKLGNMLLQLVNVIKIYKYLDRDGEIDRILGNLGVSIELTQPNDLRFTRTDKFTKKWNKVFPNTPIPETGKEVLEMLVGDRNVAKNNIDELNASIDTDDAGDVEVKCGIEKKVFKKLVALKYKTLSDKDAASDVKKITDEADVIENVFEQHF